MALSGLEQILLGSAAIPSVISLFGGSSGGRTPQSTSLAVGDEQAFRGVSLDAFRWLQSAATAFGAPGAVERRTPASLVGRR